ncbi:uncharacterized protein FIBRA_08109 [Fibroporia radiculosa]|uniref:Uncharacterized protein n=1 Tax=Fibroporia radiculosa TaxID=599839 RepID=J4I262_9APHY|nr:uncharacterized protein FIBRA_08109 [Fibroporia radiculosa]CCM05872.1 predicted protein [Fibroporia radiculosa]
MRIAFNVTCHTCLLCVAIVTNVTTGTLGIVSFEFRLALGSVRERLAAEYHGFDVYLYCAGSGPIASVFFLLGEEFCLVWEYYFSGCRVAELEQENARLLALTQSATPTSPQDDEMQSEVERLRKQLAEIQERERALAEELSRKASERSPSPAPSSTSSVKSEAVEPSFLRSPKVEKSSASFGLMVLLCALPTLLSMPSHSHSNLPSTFSLPPSHGHSSSLSTALDMPGSFLPSSDFDWSLDPVNSGLDFDFDFDSNLDDRARLASAAAIASKRLEFVGSEGAGEDTLSLGDLGALDISFDASPAENGKIRVRIHPPSSPSQPTSAASSPPASQSHTDEDHPMSVWSEPPTVVSTAATSTATSSPSLALPFESAADLLGPFLGSGPDLGHMALDREDDLLSQASSGGFDFDWDSLSRAGSPAASGRRRVRIALRSVPSKGREGGEWEVEVC